MLYTRERLGCMINIVLIHCALVIFGTILHNYLNYIVQSNLWLMTKALIDL